MHKSLVNYDTFIVTIILVSYLHVDDSIYSDHVEGVTSQSPHWGDSCHSYRSL